MFESTKIIGELQYKKTRELFNSEQEPVVGSIEYIYQNIDMSHHLFELENGTTFETCDAALGNSFAAGTTDGEGANFVSFVFVFYFILIFLYSLNREQPMKIKQKSGEN